MCTTIDLLDDLHRVARQLAHERGCPLSQVVADLIRRGLSGPGPGPVKGPRGLPVISVGRPVTAEEVRSPDDEGWAAACRSTDNLPIALTAADHVHHDPAVEWFGRTPEIPATCPIPEGTLTRFLLRD